MRYFKSRASFLIVHILIVSSIACQSRITAPTTLTASPIEESTTITVLPTPIVLTITDPPNDALTKKTINIDTWSEVVPQDIWLPNLIPNNSLYRLVMPAIYAELVRMDSNGYFQPYLAESLPTLKNGLARFRGSGEDMYLEVEFKLRPNLYWQDGFSLTAEDLIFSWELAMKPDWPGNRYGVSGVAAEVFVNSVQAPATDRVIYQFMSQRQAREVVTTGGRLRDKTLYSSLTEQFGPVVPLDYLDVGRNVLPKHLLDGLSVNQIMTSEFAKRPIYAGSYRFVIDGQDNQQIKLEAFDEFVLGTPNIKYILFEPPNHTTKYWEPPERLGPALRDKEIHAQLGLPALNTRSEENLFLAYETLTAQEGISVKWIPRDAWELLDFNLDNVHLVDLRVRQAIAFAINRQALVDALLAGHGSLMRSYLPAWHPLYAGDDNLPQYEYDPEKARTLLSEAGYSFDDIPAQHPTRGALILTLASWDVFWYSRPPIAELIQQDLKAVGIQLEVQFYGRTEFEGENCQAIRNGRRFDLAMAAWVGLGRYPVAWAERATSSQSIPNSQNGCPIEKSNWPGWQNTQVDSILTELRNGKLAMEDPERYKQLWAEHQRIWTMEIPSLPLFNPERPVVFALELSGVKPSPFAFYQVEDFWNINEWALNSP